ncbi:MAG: putative transport system permease protein, partial [Solirubrobacteraceae bacterium]|nr:putative transport system permease protein [Solirubrobacteraceae bacterium]
MIKVGLQSLAGRPARTALTMLAIVLGVAMVAAAFTVTDTMRKAADALSSAAYDGTDAVVTGRTHVETSASNEWAVQRPKVPASALAAVRALPQVGVAVGDVTDQSTKIIGADGKPIGQGPYFGIGYDSKTPGAERVSPLHLVRGQWATGPGQVVLDEGTADKAKAKIGSTVRIATDRGRSYRVTGIAHFGDVKSLGTATVAAFDLATAQREGGRGTRFDDILVGAAKGVSPAELRRALAGVVPAQATVKSAAADDRFTFDSLKSFIDIIKVALLIFGGVAIVVGAFTIFNALSITVAQRSRELGLLRLIGASRKQVLGSVVVEALALGVLASVAGVAAGYGLAHGLTALLAAMGLDLPEAGTVFATRTIAIALVVGIVVTTLAGLIPAYRATRVAPVAVLRDAAARRPGRIGRA